MLWIKNETDDQQDHELIAATPSTVRVGRIPLWIKVVFTTFVMVLVPYYWREYGPTNFFYYGDVALFLAVIAAWTVLAWWLMLIGFFALPPAGVELQFSNQPHNVNYGLAMDDAQPQNWMPQWTWLCLLLVGLPTLVFFLTHLDLKTCGQRESNGMH